MINENELNISNRSYVNKDFPVIYNEILKLAKELSNKFDPESSNESDPFIVLLKLLAFMGDKLNYNIDKNVLERFMPSATQETSMRELCEMMGYSMRYYVAPTTEVTFRYEGDAQFNTSSHSSLFIPKYTIVQDDSETLSYYTVKDCYIYGKGVATEPIGVIQGTLETLKIYDSSTITLENLDENNRIYFPQKLVAQNGVFIEGGNVSSLDDWAVVDNLNTQETGSPVYKFGYDSIKGLPYIEFPKDVANLIGSGLTIRYIITDGENGNVKAGALTKLKSPTEFYWKDTEEDPVSMIASEGQASPLVIKNVNASINGSSPESINQAYNNFKKTVGTFDTLVTCRDYANAIYNLTDSDNIFNLVSNVQVGDRRTDISHTYNIITFTEEGQETITKSSFSAYDLCLYPLKPIKNYGIETFKQSFKPLGSISQIDAELGDYKCLSHDYVELAPNDLYAIKNYYNLKARISTTSKVTKLEGATIIANINAALVSKFNARNIDFGYEIPYDDLLQTIENADKRIKSVSLYEPTLDTVYMSSNGEEYSKDSDAGKGYYIDLVAKNILGGRFPLYDYDTRFSFELDEKAKTGVDLINENIKSITTNAGITISNTEYSLLENEVVQLATPSLITEKTYPYMINYYLKLANGSKGDWVYVYRNVYTTKPQLPVNGDKAFVTNHIEEYKSDSSSWVTVLGNVASSKPQSPVNGDNWFNGTDVMQYKSSICIEKNTEYELKQGDVCIFEYTDTNQNQVVEIYSYVANSEEPTIIKPNIDLYTTDYRRAPRSAYYKGETVNYKEIQSTEYIEKINAIDSTILETEDGKTVLPTFSLKTSDEVEYRTINREKIKRNIYCYWIVNNKDNTITFTKEGTSSNFSYILEDGEYFFVTDTNFSELFTYGSGTSITLKNATSTGNTIPWNATSINLDDIDERGLLGNKEVFVYRSFSNNSYLVLTEQEVTTLLGSDSIKTTTGALALTNEYQDALSLGVQYKLSEDSGYTSLPSISYTGGYWKIRARLDINCGPDTPQTLVGNQSITINYDSETISPKTITEATIRLGSLHQAGGGDNIDVRTIDIGDLTSLSNEIAYVYDKGVNYNEIKRNSKGYLEKRLEGTGEEVEYFIPSYKNNSTTVDMLLMIHNNRDSENTGKVKITFEGETGASVVSEHTGSAFTSSYLNEGINVLRLSGVTKLTLTAKSGYYGNLVIGNLKPVFGYSSELGIDTDDISTLITKIRTLDSENKFYYNGDIDNVRRIDEDDLSSPYAFYDYNNVANKWTISQIYFGNDKDESNKPKYDIDIAKSSLL